MATSGPVVEVCPQLTLARGPGSDLAAQIMFAFWPGYIYGNQTLCRASSEIAFSANKDRVAAADTE
jgi:hypothetical protein